MEIVYNMLTYKYKTTDVEDDPPSLSPIRKKINAYTRQDKNGCDNSSAFLPYDRPLSNTVIPENTDLIRNNIPEIRYSVL